MYTSFFGFSCKPFQLTPDPEFLYMSRVHKRALTYLNYGITDNSGFILLTGEIGTGKTTIIRSLIKQFPQEIRTARINNTKVTSEQLIAMINEDFGLNTKDRDKTRMLSDLTDFLIQQYADGCRAMIIIDEAQNLTPDLLEEIRLLSNLETDKSKLLQIILIGQPELNLTLSRPELEQLRQRIAINAYISHLGRDETEEYIKHRLRVAGGENAVTFEEGVMTEIHNFTKGIPRLINILCEFALLAAFADEKRVIDADLIKEIINDLVNERPETRAAIAETNGSSRQGTNGSLKNALMRCHLRLQNVEAAVLKLQRGAPFSDEERRLLELREAELNKKEEALLKRESALLEIEEMLKKRYDNIQRMFEQQMKVILSSEEVK